MEIRVTGKKWLWQFEYPKEGVQSMGEFVVPVNQPVKLIMTSDDVLHSFYLPNFRQKRDVLPNRYTRLWFKPNREGVFQVFCTEFCGDGHSVMLATLRVVSNEEYKAWLKDNSSTEDIALKDLGPMLYTKNSCNTCHSTDGSPASGPSWKGIYGAERALTDGSVVTIDDDYIAESIVNPKEKVVAGYQPIMPTYKGLLTDREITAIIEYIKTLK